MKFDKKLMKASIPFIAITIIAGGIGFYGGTKYSSSSKDQFGNFPNGMQQGIRQVGSIGTKSGNIMPKNEGLTMGTIISKDDKSITLDVKPNGSRIVFFSGTTKISKSAEGTVTDLTEGTSVMITGTPNSDGSITAQSIQVRPTTVQQK